MTRIVALSLTLLTVLACAPAGADASHPTAADSAFYELRIYTFTSAQQQALVEQYWEKAAVPGLNRLGVNGIGVFKEMETQEGEAAERIVVLIPYKSLAEFGDLHERLSGDAIYVKQAAPYVEAEKNAPAFARIETSLLQALYVQPALRTPDTGKPRLFEMREYEGHSEKANDQKMYMFNDVEADVFAESGLTSVFYAKTLIGKNRPSLFYMVTFDDMDDHAKDWDAFRENPNWAAARTSPKYEGGGVSGRSTYMLLPLKCSQI